ncbi:MAG: 7-cyano-7-deazaguanine synthase [Pseudomarimonas sp.]
MQLDLEPIDVRYVAGRVELSGPINQSLTIKAQALIQRLMENVSPRELDLICVAGGVYAIDRVFVRGRSESNDTGIRTFAVRFYVEDIAYWNQQSICDQLAELLHFLTGDCWLLSFAADSRPLGHAEQSILDLPRSTRPERIALYSGGLDSAAGLACRIIDDPKPLLLLTIGHQTAIRRSCVDQIRALKHVLAPAGANIFHASFVAHLNHAKRMRDQEKSQRARSFLFCAMAALVASTWRISTIELFENGAGAINLPLASGSLTGGMTTRGSHPTFLQMMSRLSTSLFDYSLSFSLPYLELTKAAMLKRIARVPKLDRWLHMSRSCIHTSIRESGIHHCGICPACIERRQAFYAAGIHEPISQYCKDVFTDADALRDDYLRAYLDNAVAWTTGDAAPAHRLKDHCAITELTGLDVDLHRLHQLHALETLATFGHLLGSENPDPARANCSPRVAA